MNRSVAAVRPQVERGWLSSIGWSVASQGLSSTTNFGLTAALAVSASIADFGRLVSLQSIYLLALTLGRSLFTEPLVAADHSLKQATDHAFEPVVDRASERGRSMLAGSWHRARRRLTQLAVPFMAVAIFVGFVVGSPGWTLVLLVGPLPILLRQDGQRYVAWAANRPGLATALDGVWLGTSVVTLAVGLLVSSAVTPGLAVLAWSLGGVASWLIGLLLVERAVFFESTPFFESTLFFESTPFCKSARSSESARSSDSMLSAEPAKPAKPSGPRARSGDGWAMEPRYRRLAASQAMMAGAVNLGPVAVAVALSPSLAATGKAILLPFTVVLSLLAGTRVVTLPAIRRAVDRDGGGRSVGTMVAAAGAVAGLGALLSLLVVDRIPKRLLGESLTSVEPLLYWGVALCVLYVIGQQLSDAVALAGATNTISARAAAIVAEWGGLFCGAAVAGVHGLVVGWTVGLAIATAIWLKAWSQAPRQP